MDWDLLRTFESVTRHGSLTAAAQALRLSQSTVSRQMTRLEALSKSPLMLRTTPLQLTARGEALKACVLPMVDLAQAAQAALEDSDELQGEVTLATVGELLRWTLAPRLAAFHKAYPRLRLRILSDNRVRSLAAGEADVSVRLARPERGDLVAKKLHVERYALYAAKGLELRANVPWLGLTGSLAHIPEQRWAEQFFAPQAPQLLLEDIEALAMAAADGLGVALLPRRLAPRHPGLVEVPLNALNQKEIPPIPSREVWWVVHRTKQRLPKVRALIDWLTDQEAGWQI